MKFEGHIQTIATFIANYEPQFKLKPYKNQLKLD